MDEGFEHPAVRPAGVHPPAEVEEIGERSGPLPGLDDALRRASPHPPDRAEPEADPIRPIRDEGPLARVHVGGPDGDSEVAAVVHEEYHPVRVVHLRGQRGGHERGRMVALEPRRLVGHERVGDGVRAVEPVLGEVLHEVEEGVRDLRVHPVTGRPRHERGPLPGHFLGQLLAHRLAQHVGAAEAVPGELAGDLHHLLLVQDHPVGRPEDGLDLRVGIGHPGQALLALDEVVHHPGLEGPRPEQGDQGDDVLEPARLEVAHELAHPPRLELEHPGGGAGADQLVGLRVVGRHRPHVDGWLAGAGGVDHGGGPVDDGQGLEPEEVELDEAHRLHVVLVELGHRQPAVRIAKERRVIGEGTGGDDHSPRVAARVAGEAFERAGEIDEGAHVLAAFVVVPERDLLRERPVEGDPEVEGDELRDHVHEGEGKAEHPPRVANHRLRRHRAEGDDLRHPVRPVAGDHVVDDPVAPLHAEVDVEVGHRDPFRIEKALE